MYLNQNSFEKTFTFKSSRVNTYMVQWLYNLIFITLMTAGCKDAYRTPLSSDTDGNTGGSPQGGSPTGGLSGGQQSGGVQGGVQGGIQGGIQGGVQGGIQGGTSGGNMGGIPEPPIESLNPKVHFKGPRRLSMDLQMVLELSETEICSELGLYSCLDFVHPITLGGIEPYRQNIYTPASPLSATAPLAIERVIYSACGQRILQDFNQPNQARIFKNLNLSPDGRLMDINQGAVEEVIQTFFKRSFLRLATPQEVESLKRLYQTIADSNVQLSTAQWGWAMCHGVLTSVEFLFY